MRVAKGLGLHGATRLPVRELRDLTVIRAKTEPLGKSLDIISRYRSGSGLLASYCKPGRRFVSSVASDDCTSGWRAADGAAKGLARAGVRANAGGLVRG
jgi:hypothetical protein